MRGRQGESSSSGSDIYIQIPSIMKHTETSKSKLNSKKKKSTSKDPRSKSKQEEKKEPKLKKDQASLTKKMKECEKQIQHLREQISEDKTSLKYMETFNQTQAEYEKLIRSYEETIQNFKKNEMNLLDELTAQSQIAKDALNKLFEFQQEHNAEREKLKQYYENYYRDKEQELQRKFDLQLQQMQFQPKESHVAIDFDNSQTKLKDLMRKEQYYLEEIESLKTRLNAKHPSQREKELKQKLFDMELRLQEWEENIEKIKQLEQENSKLVLKVNFYEKKLIRKTDKVKRLKEEWSKQYHDLQAEIKYWKGEMDKVILENNLVLSKLNPNKR